MPPSAMPPELVPPDDVPPELVPPLLVAPLLAPPLLYPVLPSPFWLPLFVVDPPHAAAMATPNETTKQVLVTFMSPVPPGGQWGPANQRDREKASL
jgi:hypothetical protein